MSGRVVVVGSVNVDLVVQAQRLPGPGETVVGGTFEQHPGGKGGNQAVAAARAGARASFIGAVGDDPLGRVAMASLASEGIDLAYLATQRGSTTGVALIVVDEAGENAIAVAPGANGGVSPEHVRSALDALAVGRGDVVLVSHEIPESSVRAALAAASAYGAVAILNPAPAVGLTQEAVAEATIVTPNRSELGTLVHGDRDEDTEASARRLFALLEAHGRADAVVVTLGWAGALLVRRRGLSVAAQRMKAPEVVVEDSTGAGDTFNGVLAAALADGLEIDEAVERAVVAGSLATTKVGAREAMPTRADVDEKLGAFRAAT
jgi:ribokinase